MPEEFWWNFFGYVKIISGIYAAEFCVIEVFARGGGNASYPVEVEPDIGILRTAEFVKP